MQMRKLLVTLLAGATLFTASVTSQAVTLLQLGWDGNGGTVTFDNATQVLSGSQTGKFTHTSGLSLAPGFLDATAKLTFTGLATNAGFFGFQGLSSYTFKITNAAGTVVYVKGVATPIFPNGPGGDVAAYTQGFANNIDLSSGDDPFFGVNLTLTSDYALGPYTNEAASFTSNARGYSPPNTGIDIGVNGFMKTKLFTQISGNISGTLVPEPGALAMLVGMGVAGSALLLRRRKK
jgi:hypothetical protein